MGVVIVDCCREFVYSEQKGTGSAKDLSPTSAEDSSPTSAEDLSPITKRSDTFIICPCRPCDTITDSNGGLLTGCLKEHLTKPIPMRKMFGLVMRDVRSKSNNKRHPFVHTDLYGDDFCLFGSDESGKE